MTTPLGSKVIYELTPQQLKDFAKEVIKEWQALEPGKKSTDVLMTKKQTAKYLQCDVNTVNRRVLHLRHMIKGKPYWYASEIENFIKRK